MPEDDYEWVVRSYPQMKISLQYCEPLLKARLVATYNLLLRLEECITRISDPAISRAKLSWWHEELSRARTKSGSHPVTIGLQDCGALTCWSASLLDSLFQQTLDRVDAEGLCDGGDLQRLCETIGATHFQLESSLSGAQPADLHEGIAGTVVNGLMQILRESYLAKLPTFFWVPLTHIAQTGLVRSAIASNRNGPESRQLLLSTLDGLLAKNSLEVSASSLARNAGCATGMSQHWFILSVLQQRQLNRLRKKLEVPEFSFDIIQELHSMNMADGWAAWRSARHFGSAQVEAQS